MGGGVAVARELNPSIHIVVRSRYIAAIDQGTLGGESSEINLENEGLTVEFNDGFDLPDDVRSKGEDAIAGIIAGERDADYAGVAPDAHLVSLKVLNGDGSGDTSAVIAAIDWAVAHGARVISMSLTEFDPDDDVRAAVTAAQRADVVLVAAVGNAPPVGAAGDPALARRIGAAGRATAATRFSIHRFVHDWDLLLRDACGQVGLVSPGGAGRLGQGTTSDVRATG